MRTFRAFAALALAGVVVGGCAADAIPSPPLVETSVEPSPSEPPSTASVAPPNRPTVLWSEVTDTALGTTAEWTNKVEIGDIDGDGRPDLLFANGGDYESPGTAVPVRAFANQGSGAFREVTSTVFGNATFLSRVVKVVDVDNDGANDVIVGGTYGTPTRLFGGAGDGTYTEEAHAVPATPMSVGDLEAGDVDADGDLDLVLADWGEGSPMENAGGRIRLWRNEDGQFVEARQAMPDVLVRFSWDLELVDVDGDWDLDAVISCKVCPGGLLLENDGAGTFGDVTSGRLPQFTNNYDYEAMDLDGDGDPELVTINDGPDSGRGLTEHVLRNEHGSFVDATSEWWPAAANVGSDDNVAVFLDADSDGDADFLVGSLDGEDRLLRNDGSGALSLSTGVFDQSVASRGTLGMAVSDLDGDGRLDVVEGQGEVAGHEAERVYLGTGIAPDTAAPQVTVGAIGSPTPGRIAVVARVHDRLTPVRSIDFAAAFIRWSAGADRGEAPLVWSGGDLWRADARVPGGVVTVEVCATDRAGNESCREAEPVEVEAV